MKDLLWDDFENTVSDVLIRHKSILDIMAKLEESNAKINRALTKSVTACGCIKINGEKQDYTKESIEEIKKNLKTHVEGTLCDNCKEKIEEELGDHLFYIAALSTTLDLNIYDSIIKKYKELKALGIYSML
ncbi:MazG nucleotide pyrophosphohydrolase domain-containing protein [Thermohalobacter berrensis]|uniref:DUF1573 domain-containing protein n=1 Tax=Thermohalobacter berrensis TaxID=99594 RepID=A0A419T8L7_9FIRM|nr:MazG nucleotide pyrophosphohydrolase domain-containing protein [Thermohalobacter berrensis]RKD33763.1 DUF1573 domain-containing protein [Thermohalobacter berrensis]